MSYNVTRLHGTDLGETIKKFQTFEDLEVYKVARNLRKAMYALAQRLPDFEKHGNEEDLEFWLSEKNTR